MYILKAVKNDIEITNLKNVHIDDGLAVTRFIFWLKKAVKSGQTITEASAAEYLDNLRSGIKDYIELSFDTISAYADVYKRQIEENDVEKIVVGLPKNMNNTVGERAIACEEFAKNLERRTGLEVIMWDERLTTVSAEKALMESGVRRENRKAVIDQIAAVFILQGYLDCQANAGR